MNYEQALKASKHNPRGVVGVLKKLEVECPKYGGVIQKRTICKSTGLQCTGKVPYFWTPQTADWVYCKENRRVICLYYNEHHGSPPDKYTNPKTAIPILEWEVIEEVLWQAGYWVKVERISHQVCHVMIGTYQKDYQTYNWIKGASYTEAVYEAVTELGKRIK